MHRRWLVGLVVVVGSCTSTVAGQPLPMDVSRSSTQQSSTNAPGTPSVTLPASGAPKVVSPIDPGPFPQDPCRLVTEVQAKQLGVQWPGKPQQGATAPACDWGNLDTGAHIVLQFETVTKLGLSKTYRQRDTYGYFIEIPSIEGVPAVAVGDQLDQQAGACSLWVGVTDELAFLLGGRLSTRNRQQGKDPCQAVQVAAGMALKTMKGEA